MLRIPWSTDIGLAHPQICVTLISLIAWSRSPTISAAKRLGGQRSRGISLPSWKLSHLFYIGVLAFIFSKTRGPVHSLMAGAQGTDKARVRSLVLVNVIPLAAFSNFHHKWNLSGKSESSPNRMFIISKILETWIKRLVSEYVSARCEHSCGHQVTT